MPSQTIRVRYANGVFTPLEPVGFEDGCDVVLECSTPEPAKRTGLLGMLDLVNELHESMPDDAWDDQPTDLAANKKHYLYGYPKERNE